jgi:hypothetical protein
VDGRAHSHRHGAAGERGAHQAAEAEQAMERRHDRPAVALLHEHRMGVHGDVERADADPEQHERRQQEREVRCEQRQGQHGAEQQGRQAG